MIIELINVYYNNSIIYSNIISTAYNGLNEIDRNECVNTITKNNLLSHIYDSYDNLNIKQTDILPVIYDRYIDLDKLNTTEISTIEFITDSINTKMFIYYGDVFLNNFSINKIEVDYDNYINGFDIFGDGLFYYLRED